MASNTFIEKLRDLWTNPDGTIALVSRLFAENYRENLGTFGLAIICMALASASTAAFAWLMRDVVNDIFTSHKTGVILILSIAVIAISAIKGFAAYGQAITLGRIGNRIAANYQRRLVDKFLTFGLDFFTTTHSSNLMVRVTRGARSPAGAIMLVSTSLGRDLLTLVALAGVMVIQDPLMSLIAFAMGPFAILGVRRMIVSIKKLAEEEMSAFAQVIAATQEAIRGIRIVKGFTLEPKVREDVDDAVSGAELRANKINAIRSSSHPLMESLGGITIGLVILYAGWQTTTAGKTPGEFVAFMAAFLLAYEPFKRLARLNVTLQLNLRMVRMIYEILDSTEEEKDVDGAIELEAVAGLVTASGINFGYKEDIPVLKDVTIRAEPGKVTALVGPSGAGKSTLVSLMQRFYMPWSGSIEIDGHDIQNVTLGSLRRNISFVSQDTYLFSGTVQENIALGRLGATEAEIRDAANAANATDFILDLPDGFDTDMGENGATLSGGQRQRIAIARAVLRDAPILLLDEATSALDTESERLIHSAIKRLMVGRTTIVVAHRLSTIAEADRTYLMDDGKIIASGRHAELLETSGLYQILFGTRDTNSSTLVENPH